MNRMLICFGHPCTYDVFPCENVSLYTDKSETGNAYIRSMRIQYLSVLRHVISAHDNKCTTHISGTVDSDTGDMNDFDLRLPGSIRKKLGYPNGL